MIAEVHWVDRQQQAHLRGDLDHRVRLQNASANATKTGESPANCMRIFAPWASDNSTVQGPVAVGAVRPVHGNSTNRGGNAGA